MIGYRTSLASMFAGRDDRPTVSAIRIPIVQRDYAQGRRTPSVDKIRAVFLDVLCDAITGGDPVGLDFVYGEIDSEATLHPLDGQQRLTTLFLLHWYLAFRSGRLGEPHPWKAFSYATRPSADKFCRRLVEHTPPVDDASPAAWLADQPWFNHAWSVDPTIQSMLTVIADIDERLATADHAAALDALHHPTTPAVSFYMLPLGDVMNGDDLYIKMNSRGKPLTPFENFKARFERTLTEVDADQAKEFAHRIDGPWSDVMWPIHGGDFIVDDELMRYIEYLTEICEWRQGEAASGPLERRAETVFGPDNPAASDHIDFLFASFDCWVGRNLSQTFDEWFATSRDAVDNPLLQVALVGQADSTNLLDACAHTFGTMRGKARVFTFGQGLLLYAVLLHLTRETHDFPRRLRVLRNLIAGSEAEMRGGNMSKLLAETEQLIVSGDLDALSTFRQTQIDDERRKSEFLSDHSELASAVFRLEDHPMLRGTLTAFDLNPTSLQQRAATFAEVFDDATIWSAVTAALLATGDYFRQWFNTDAERFGTGTSGPESVWRELFTAARYDATAPTRDVLMKFLDSVAQSTAPLSETLESIRSTWLSERQQAQFFDWRYHFVKYDWMREGDSGIYYYGDIGRLDYEIAMLRRFQLNSNYRDAFGYAMWRESGVGDAVDDPWFTGWSNLPRWMRFKASGAAVRCISPGLLLRPPPEADHVMAFNEVAAEHGAVASDGMLLIRIPQQTRGDAKVDTIDRVQLGAELLRDLTRAGL